MKPFLSFDRQFSGVTFSIFLAQGFTFSATTQPNYLPRKKGGTKNIREIKCLLPFGDPNTKKKKKSISKSDDVSLYGQQRRRMCVPKSVAISHVSLTKHFSPNFQKACQSAGHWQLRWCGIFNRAATLKYIECITKSSSRSQLKSSSGLSFD